MDVSRRMSTRDQRPPSAFCRSRKECVLLARMFCVRYFDSQFEVSFLLHYSVTSVSDYFCFSMGATDGWFHLSLFLGLVFTFFHLFQSILYTVWRRKFLALVQRTKFFLKWILNRGQEALQPSTAAGRSASHWSRTYAWSSGASQARFGSRGLSRARSEAAVEETGLLLEASVSEF